MRLADGPRWQIEHHLPYHVNFVLWLKRREERCASYPESLWSAWLERVALRNNAIAETVDLAPDPGVRSLAAEHWPVFVREFNQDKPQLAARLTNAVNKARIQEIMGDSDQCFTFLHTNHPGDFCWHVGDAWVLGEAYLDAQQIRSLVARLVTGEGSSNG